MDWIQGDKFKALATFTFSPKEKQAGDYDNLESNLDCSKLSDVNLIYTHTIYAKSLFETIAGLKSNFIVITHNADENVNSTFHLPDNVLRWFTQNVDVCNPRIDSIPIGLENDRWFKGLKKKEKMLGLLTQYKSLRNWVYMNHNVGTNPAKREAPYYYLENQHWVTAHRGTNGHHFDEYIENVYHHPFVICPEGNGIDTHRMWEALYMNSIPIVRKNINNQFYADLPICFIHNWNDITLEFLEEEWVKIKSKEWNTNKLTFAYWKDKITGYGK